MIRMLLVFLPLMLIFMNSCTHCEEGKVCIEFDQRQCSADVWAELVYINDSEEEREENMKTYLESLGFEVDDVNLVIDYHNAVCEACTVCPEEDRFFVKIAEEDKEEFLALDYLNIAEVACRDAF